MIDKILFWVVLVWMVGLLVMGFIAVREIWREAGQPPADPDAPAPQPPDPASGGVGKPGGEADAAGRGK